MLRKKKSFNWVPPGRKKQERLKLTWKFGILASMERILETTIVFIIKSGKRKVYLLVDDICEYTGKSY